MNFLYSFFTQSHLSSIPLSPLINQIICRVMVSLEPISGGRVHPGSGTNPSQYSFFIHNLFYYWITGVFAVFKIRSIFSFINDLLLNNSLVVPYPL